MCERFDEDGVVSPACLRKGLFIVGALDNLDRHNPTSTTSQSSFYGTGISLYNFQLQKSWVNVDHQLPLLPLGPQSMFSLKATQLFQLLPSQTLVSLLQSVT